MTSQAAELVRNLGKDIGNMKPSVKTCLLKRLHSSTERLQGSIDMHSYLLTTAYCDPPENSKPFPKLFELSNDQQADAESESHHDLEKDSDLTTQKTFSGTLPPAFAAQAESYHETMRKQSRRLHSWPSREVDAFEDDGGLGVDSLPRMRALESTAALSLATFTSLLIEFVARLDHLAEAVDELSKLAKFKNEGL